MQSRLLGLLAVFMLMFGTLLAPTVSADSTDEAYYVGQVNVLIDITNQLLVEFHDLSREVDDTDTWKATAITICRSWAILNDVAQHLDAPRSYESVQENFKTSYDHLQKAGELFEEGITEEDADIIDDAFAELNESAKYLTLANDEMLKIMD